ncbi:MAG: enoyl-CoA hydratase/isomerase family protein [Beijerinckiaceae bacterium]
MSEQQTLRTEMPHEGVRLLVIARPAKRNALDGVTYRALTDALRAADDDGAVRAVVITGEGGHFTAGNDLADFMGDAVSGARNAVDFLHTISTFSKPVIAAVEGNAIGIGVTMLQHCDFAYVASNVKMAMPFITLGLCPEGGSSLLLPKIAGTKMAADLLMTGRMFDGAFAVAAGLANETVAPGAALGRALAQAQTVAALPAEAMRVTKKLLKRADATAVREAIDVEAEHFAQRLHSQEAQAAFMAFFAKKA